MKKNRLSKRALSLLLSALMVITSAPLTFAPIVAQADVAAPNCSGTESVYFASSDTWDDNITSTNVTWDGTSNAASFAASSYAKLNGRPLQGVTATSGWIVSFNYETGNLGADSYSMNFVNGSNRMTFINGSSNWWMMVSLEISNGTKTRVYEGDFTKTDYLSTTYSAASNDSLWWSCVNLTYIMETDGSLTLIVTKYTDNTFTTVSDTFTVVYKSNYGATAQGHGMTDAEVAAVLSSLTDYYVGAGDNTASHDYQGKVKNLRIFPNSQVRDLQLAMINYENAMSKGTVYTNMAAAYKKYVDACEAYDAFCYGGSTGQTNAQVASATTALNTATSGLTEWTTYQGTLVTSAADNSYSTATLANSDAMNNVLYTYGVGSGATRDTGGNMAYNSYGSEIYSHYGAIVFLYNNGATMSCPINADFHNGGAGNNKLRYIIINGTADFSLSKNWKGSTTDGYQTGSSYQTSYTTTESTIQPGKNTTVYFSNTLYTTKNPGSNYTVGPYYVSYRGQNNKDNYSDVTSTAPIYYVNYTYYMAQVKAANGLNFNVANYKEGGLLARLQAYDTATSYNPTTRLANNTSTNVATGVSNISSDMSTRVSNLTAVGTAPTADSSNKNYVALRNAIDYSGVPTGLASSYGSTSAFSVRDVIAAGGKCNVSGTTVTLDSNGSQTLTGFSTLQSAYNEAVAVMAALGESGNNTNTNSNYTDSTAATKASTLMSAFNSLSLISVNAPTTSGNTYLGPEDLITVTDTNSGGATYTWQYSTYDGTNWSSFADGGSVAAAGGTFAPFSNAALVTAGTVKIRVAATKTVNNNSATEYDNSAGVTYTYLAAPSITGVTAGAAGSSATITAQTSGLTSGVYYSIDDGANWTAVTSGNSISPFELNGNVSVINVWAKQVYVNNNVTSTSETTKIQGIKKQPAAPTINVDAAVMDASHGFTLTNNCHETDTSSYPVTLYYSYDNSSWTQYTSGTILPFENDTNAKTIYAKAVRNGLETTANTTVTYLTAPTYSVATYTELTPAQTVTITNTAAGGTVYYRLDGEGDWIQGTSVQPFNGSSKLVRTIQAKVESGGSVATAGSITVIRNLETVADVYFEKADGSSIAAGRFESESGDVFKVATPLSSYANQQIYYQASVDGGAFGAFTAYNINSGIPAFTYESNQIVTFRFYITNVEGKTIVAQGTFYNNDTSVYNELLFHESFDNASVSGSTLTLSNGDTATANNSGASVEEGAGWKDSNGNSPDWRNNVLKINGYNNHDGYYKVTFNENPLANSATAAIAAREGVTISFWRYVSGGDGNDNREVANVGYWTPAISFNQDNYHYFDIMQSAYTTRSDGAVDGDSDHNKYVDIKPDVQDYTGHATGNLRNRWVNIVVTIDPANGVTVYTNGEPHNTTVTAGTGGSDGNYTGNNSALAADIISFITNASTDITLADGHAYWATDDKDLYLDDIRIYTGVKTQVDINNMYIDDYADVQTDLTSTSHDPTNVTVYTLAGGISYTTPGGTAKTTTAGQQVGQEFLDYYGIAANDTTKVTAVDYYSFGTGLTIYHWNATTKKWDVVGDSAGRCGYQNQGLFGAEYTTALSAPLAYAGTESNAGAGYLVWAPHVMYNLVTDHWMYYGSTSSWGSQKSAIFYCENTTNDSVTGPYTYQDFVYKSTSHPNGIDACVYYKYVSDGAGGYKPDPDYLYMAFGSWGGASAIATKTLDVDGGTEDYTGFQGIICRGIDSDLEGASDGGSGEGAYVTFNNGYYYLYVSYGQNTGSYVERVFRSTSPNSGFVDFGNISATDSSTKVTHGNQILGPFDMSNYDYIMVSTGHNSVYKAVNDYGEIVSVNSVHARPNASDGHNWIAVPDGALATAQYDPSASTTDSPNGNINMVNMLAYTSNGWPVMMPFQYDGTDTCKASTMNLTAADLEGVYAADDLQVTEYYNWSGEYRYTIIADEEATGADANKCLFEYGTDDGGDVFTDYIVLSTGADGTQYANYYSSKAAYAADPTDILYYGVVGTHGTGASKEICITMICSRDKEHTWTYRTGEIPHSDDVESLGDSVSMDGVIYTHKANSSYAMYGHEISDDFYYGTTTTETENSVNYTVNHQGERCTTITTTYPAKIDLSNPSAVYCVSDEALAREGYSGGDFKVVALNDNKWFDASGNKFTDAQAVAAEGVSPSDGTTLQRRYGIKGYVSNYYFDEDEGTYANKGVELIVSYNNVEDGASYSEFEFCYVMANPAMAHTIQGIRNQSTDGAGANRRAGQILYDRFRGSYGEATDIISTHVKGDTNSTAGSSSTGSPKLWGTGVFSYNGVFGNAASVTATYDSPKAMADHYTFFDSDEGTNSGSYGIIEHQDKKRKAYTVSSAVVDADYYIDYSNTDNYQSNNPYGLITVNGSGVPTGYAFDFRTSNIQWRGDNDQNRRWNATSYVFTSGEAKTKLTMDSTYDSSKDTYVSGSESSNSGEQRYTYGNYYWNSTSYDSTIGAIFDRSSSTSGDYELDGKTGIYSTDKVSFEISGVGKYSTNSTGRDSKDGNVLNKDTLSFNKEDGTDDYRKVMDGYYYNPSAYTTAYGSTDGEHNYYTKGLTRGLPLINSGLSDTNTWNMHITFTGRDNVAKNADPGSEDTERAEKYANFIIEQGIGVFSYATDRYATVEETYAYYNIGVSTCDKGAARTFVDEYLNRQLAVTDNGDGTVTVKVDNTTGAPIYLDANGDETTDLAEAAVISPQYYTLASYQDYIDAIAELAWFVEAPTNTTFGDYWGYTGGAGSTHYSTAYTAGGDPIYITTTAGDNVFDEGATNVNTDTVQAQLIDNVITAYEQLFNVNDYKNAEEIFGAIELKDNSGEATATPANVTTITVTPAEGAAVNYTKADYTNDSWSAFVNLVINEANAFKYYTNNKEGDAENDYQEGDIDLWRRVELSGVEYRQLTDILKDASASLLPVVDIAALSSTYTTKHATDVAGIFTREGGKQEYTMASWSALDNECATANTLLGTAQSTSGTIAAANVVNGGESEPDFTYTQGRYAVTGVTKYDFDGVTFYSRTINTSAPSAVQTQVNTENTTLGGLSLVQVDSEDAYQNFDTVNLLLHSLNLDKYTTEGQTLIEALKADTGHNYQYGVYGLPSAEDAAAYETATGNDVSETYLRRTTSGGTDAYITALKSQLSELETDYVRQLNAELYVSENGAEATKQGATQTVSYGDTFEFDLSSILDDTQIQGVSYQVEYYNTYSGGTFSDKTATNNTWVKGSSFSLVADNNIKVTATITSEDNESAFTNKLTIYNAYRHPLQIVYTNTSFAPGTQGTLVYNDGTQDITVEAPALMFYTFANWRIYQIAANEYSAVPMYNTTGTYGFTVGEGGTISANTASYDEEITLNTSVANFVAWAAVKDNKYQIISYNTEYSFYTVTNEDFVVIVQDGSDYKVNGTDIVISASNIDSAPDLTNAPTSSTGTPLDATAVIKHKLANHYPFISVVGAYYNDVQQEGQKNKARIYLRVTDGATGDYTAGVIASNIPGVATTPNYKATNILSNGQCSITISRAYGKLTAGTTFAPYINYDFVYSGSNATLTDHTNATYTVAQNDNI